MAAVEILGEDATALAARIRRREISCRETIEATIEAISRIDPLLNAFCTTAFEQAVETASRVDERMAAGLAVGPLAGVPVAVKDLIFTKGIRTTFGSRIYAGFVPDEDDVAVARLRAADAIVIGKTNACEFGLGGFGHNRLFPTTRNPWDRNLTSGGSSAGSAAAVAAGLCPIALGSDGGGSVRLPAAFTGIVGVKPSMGRIPLWPGCRDPRFPGASGWESIEHYGTLSRSVRDAALFLSVVCGPDARDRLSLPAGDVDWLASAQAPADRRWRVAYCPRWAGLPVDHEVVSIVEREAFRIRDELGFQVDEVETPIGDMIAPARAIVALETDLTGMRALAAGREDQLSPGVRALLGHSWSAEDFTDAITARKAVAASMAQLMSRYDILLTPALPLPAFPIDQAGPGRIDGVEIDDDNWSAALYPANLTGQPAASIPVGLTSAGLPVGLHIVGSHLADASVLSFASLIEKTRQDDGRRPPFSIWNSSLAQENGL